MVLLTAAGCLGSFAVGPFVGLSVYILYAVLRPQYIWKWSLEPDVSWSFYVAVPTILAFLFFGSRPPTPVPGRCPPARFRFTWSHALFLGFVVTIVASYLLARNRAAAEFYMEEYAKIFLMMFVGLFCITTVGQVWTLYLIYTLSIAYIAYEVNIEYLTKGYMWIYHSGFGGLDNNGAGILLAMGVPLCVFAWEYYRRWYRWCFVLLIPVIIHAVLMTYSRGAMVSLIAAGPFWLFRGKYRWQKIAVGCAVLTCVPFLAGQEIRNRFWSLERTEEDASSQSRLKVMKIGLQIASEYPLFGIGVRNSPLVTYEYGADIPGRIIHCQYIQLAADCGFIGAGIYMAIVGLTLWNFRKVAGLARQYDDIDSRRSYFAACGFHAALMTFAVGATFLSLELFEPQYYIFMAAVLLRNIYESGVAAAAGRVRAGLTTPADPRGWGAGPGPTVGTNVERAPI
jgi:probable O-glycosylation ligase (exosortase A-associated)